MERDVVRYPKSHSGHKGFCLRDCQRKGQYSMDVLGYRAGCSFSYVFSHFDNLCVVKKLPQRGRPLVWGRFRGGVGLP